MKIINCHICTSNFEDNNKNTLIQLKFIGKDNKNYKTNIYKLKKTTMIIHLQLCLIN
jgi:hypothetical protein